MPDKTEISEAEFVAAFCVVAAVVAEGVWQYAQTSGKSMKRPALAETAAAMDCQAAAKYCGFGRTRFRQLVANGVFPQSVTIEGRKRWLVKDLNVALVRLGREQRNRK